jgi:putative ABC transport system permease protein
MRFVRIPLLDLRRRPVRTALTMAGVALAVAGHVTLNGLSAGLERAWRESFEARGTDVVGIRKGAVEILATSLEEGTVARVAKAPGVDAAAGELLDLLALENGQTAIVCGWGAGSYLWKSVRLAEGTVPDRAGDDAVVLGELTARLLGKRPGDSIRLLDSVFTVSGVSKTGTAIVGTAVLMPLARLQRLIGREGQVTAIHVRLRADDGGASHRERAAELERLFPGLAFSDTGMLADRNYVLSLLRALAWLTSSIGLGIAAVVVVNTLLMSVIERTREMGMLAVVGWSRARVMAVILIEAGVLCAGGGAVGAVAGAALVRQLASAAILRGIVEPHVSIGLVLQSVCGATILGLVVAVYPAWRAVSIAPAGALRYE